MLGGSGYNLSTVTGATGLRACHSRARSSGEPVKRTADVESLGELLAEEPAQSQGLNSKPKLSSLSLFEWALSAEQERGKELVGCGELDTGKMGRLSPTLLLLT